MLTMISSPVLMHGLLDDNLTAWLDDLVNSDAHISIVEGPSALGTVSFGDALPMPTSFFPGQPLAHLPTFDQDSPCDDNINNSGASQRRTGSGEI